MYSLKFGNKILILMESVQYAGIEYSDSLISKKIQNATYKEVYGVEKDKTASHAFVIYEHPETLIWQVAESHLHYGGIKELPVHEWLARKNKDKNRGLELWTAPINVETANRLANYNIPYAVTDLVGFTKYLKGVDRENQKGAICSEYVASVMRNNQINKFFQLKHNRWDAVSPAMVQFFFNKNFGKPIFKIETQ